ncbi:MULTISPECIES: sigma-70 family RNA polymerase sigma factor [Nitrincola]|uniref:RNA polymerase sigma factor sigM n=1 Tax=Nitrincola nitratireducens TaxID=1229521 RepID=W9V8Y8_9GAMM|nr:MULTISPECIES: sigma-70 family RNA polymerase sigma factor [Nitrincola]EXJ12537.1 RNA polymerase sigma factor sigM [Nitrincola nitratireducens]
MSSTVMNPSEIFDTSHQEASIRDYTQRLNNIRPRLLAFARLQMSDKSFAEDLVQETLITAWEKLHDFRGESRFETWVFGILRYKLLDEIRRKTRIASFQFSSDDLPEIDMLFKDNEQWTDEAAPSTWTTPDDSLENDHFWQVFDICVYHLPEKTARVFTLRELMGLETDEICDSLNISEDNCWTILHRARVKLRSCLERSWFSQGEIK